MMMLGALISSSGVVKSSLFNFQAREALVTPLTRALFHMSLSNDSLVADIVGHMGLFSTLKKAP